MPPSPTPAAARDRLPVDSTSPATPREEIEQAALDFLAQRFSVGPKHLTQPAPDMPALRRAVRIALRAPDHQQLRPFRFVIVPDGERTRLAELFAAGAERRGLDTAEVERARARAHNGPALIALVGRVQAGIEDVPETEQWVSIGAGLMNFLNALHLMGFGAKVVSGSSVRDAAMRAAFCAEDETLVAWIVAGTPRTFAHPKGDDDLEHAISTWQPREAGSA